MYVCGQAYMCACVRVCLYSRFDRRLVLEHGVAQFVCCRLLVCVSDPVTLAFVVSLRCVCVCLSIAVLHYVRLFC